MGQSLLNCDLGAYSSVRPLNPILLFDAALALSVLQIRMSFFWQPLWLLENALLSPFILLCFYYADLRDRYVIATAYLPWICDPMGFSLLVAFCSYGLLFAFAAAHLPHQGSTLQHKLCMDDDVIFWNGSATCCISLYVFFNSLSGVCPDRQCIFVPVVSCVF